MFQWLSKDSNSIVILDKDKIIGNIFNQKDIDIILTPSFYWFAEKRFSVNFAFQVKEYLPSIFEEFTDTKDLSYQIIPKENGVFWLFAYDDKAILQALVNNEIDISKVSKIYFAQNVFSNIEPIDLNNGFILSEINGVVSKIPNAFTKSSISFSKVDKEKIFLKNGVVLKRYTDFVDENLIKKIMLPLLFLVAIEGVNTLSLWLRNKKLSTQKDAIFQSYHLPPTSFQNRAILSRLKKDINSQQKIRKFAKVVFNTPFSKDEFIKDMKITKKKATVAIKLKNAKSAKKYKIFFIDHIKFANISKTILKDNVLSLEFKL